MTSIKPFQSLNLEQQLCTIEQASELQRLGMPQESMYFLEFGTISAGRSGDIPTKITEDEEQVFSLWTAEELANYLPGILIHNEKMSTLRIGKNAEGYTAHYQSSDFSVLGGRSGYSDAPTLVQSLAELMIYLLSQAIIQLPK